MLDINQFTSKNIFQDKGAKYPLENLSGLFFHTNNKELSLEEKGGLYRDIIGNIMTNNNNKVTRVVKIKDGELIVTDRFFTVQRKQEEVNITLKINKGKTLFCTITTMSKNTWGFEVTVENMTDMVTITQLISLLYHLYHDVTQNNESQKHLMTFMVANLILCREFTNKRFEEHGILYPDNFPLFNHHTKQLFNLIKTKDDYIVECVLDTNE